MHQANFAKQFLEWKIMRKNGEARENTTVVTL